MDNCPYYHEHGAAPNLIPCCNHKHAPMPCFEGKDALVTVKVRELKCGGRLSYCQIPPNQQLDVS